MILEKSRDYGFDSMFDMVQGPLVLLTNRHWSTILFDLPQ